jgi:hypothetical protein
MENVSSPTYYYPFVMAFVVILAILQIGICLIRRKRDSELHKLYLTPEELKCLEDPDFIAKGNELKRKFMVVYLLCKAAMWSKAPYTFMLLSTLHKFTISEIGVLYIIDAIMSLIAGPFLGVFSDTFGRKFTSSLYSCSNIIVIFLRLSGSRPLAYLAQFFTGVFGGGILSTAYEAWLNYEMTKLYGDKKNYIFMYRKDIFAKIQLYDSFLSISVTICGAILFSSLGIYYSLLLSVCLSAVSLIFLLYWWDENKPNSSQSENLFKSLGEASKLLKVPSIVTLGITDSLYQSSIQIFVFVWTPVLQISAKGETINPGMCYLLMLTSFLIQNKVLEISNKIWHVNYFIFSSIFLIIFTLEFFGVYLIDSFNFRLVLLAFINVIFYNIGIRWYLFTSIVMYKIRSASREVSYYIDDII